MNVALWVVAGIMAGVYLVAGLGKLVRSHEALTADPRMGWTNDYSAGTVKFVGSMEVLAAIGLILPPLVGVAEVLTPLAATGLVVVAAGAILTHARRDEPQPLTANVVFSIASAFVAVGRFWIEPF